MNLPNKITMGRLVISLLVIILLVFPWDQVGVVFPIYVIRDSVAISLKYILAGILFVIGSFTDFLDGYLARKYKLVTDFGKAMDAIADKILVNAILIILAYDGYISLIIPVVIITRDIVVDAIKMVSGSKGKVVPASILGKIKTACMMIGMTLMLFSNLPFEIWGVMVADILIIIATILSVISACQYYLINKDVVFADK